MADQGVKKVEDEPKKEQLKVPYHALYRYADKKVGRCFAELLS